jgi:uncharacterized membrane protein HdeD (DUF308 family)
MKLAVDFGTIETNVSAISNTSSPFTAFSKVISAGIGILTVVAIIWFVYLLVTGAISYMSAGGEKGKAEEARQKLFTALIGLVLVISAIFLAQLIGWILGIDILNIAGMLNSIKAN